MRLPPVVTVPLFAVVVQLFPGFFSPSALAIECYECHGSKAPPDYRPIDASYRNITTGGFQGNHRTHMPPWATPSSCNRCHQGASDYGPGHRNAQIDISPNINGSPLTAVYRNGSTSFPQRTNPRLGNCSNVNCHFESETTAWGGVAYTLPNGCTGCHGTPPGGYGPLYTGGAVGSHGRHSRYYPGSNNCVKCHNDHSAEAKPFSHATSVGKRALVVKPRDPHNTPYGSYSAASLPEYMPSQAATHSFGTCSNTYCHSKVQGYGGAGAPDYGNPKWGETLSECNNTCHGVADHGSASPITTGSHARHLAYSFNQTKSVNNCPTCHRWISTAKTGCSGCHFPTIYAPEIYVKHVNGEIDIWFNSTFTDGSYNGVVTPVSKPAGTGYSSCGNTYCHSDGTSVATGTVPANSSPLWGAAPLACTACHGYPPGYASGTPKANSHIQHSGASCDHCHFGTTTTGSAIASKTLHVNKAYNVSAGNGPAFTYTYAPSGGSCSGISCHGGRNATWGSTLPCNECHDAPPDTVSHRKHFSGSLDQAEYGDIRIAQDFTPNATGYIMNCGNCHPMNPTKHGNGVIDVELYNVQSPSGSLKSRNPATASYTNGTTSHTDSRGFVYTNGTCSNVYCHSYNDWTTPGGVAAYSNYSTYWPPNLLVTRYYRTVSWNGPSLTCSGCHANPPRTRYPNNDLGSGDSHSWINAGDPYDPKLTNGVEERHNVNMGYNPMPCRTCHYETVRVANTWTVYSSNAQYMKNPSDVPIYNFSRHVNGTGSVDFDRVNPTVYETYWYGTRIRSLESAQYNSERMTCSNVSCHQRQTLIRWGQPYRSDWSSNQCNVCHGY